MTAKLAGIEESKRSVVTPLLDGEFEAALSAAVARPTDESPWERLEAAVGSDENQARQLLDFYRAQLTGQCAQADAGRALAPRGSLRLRLLRRKRARDDRVLRAVLVATPDVDWAFRPLVVALTMAERWSEVLDAYDARLAARAGSDRRADLLEEAARIAKDFAGDHARAVGYLEQLFRLRPADGQVASSLERLLERHERWAELVAARRLRLELLAGHEARELRLRVAITLHDKLGQPDAALAEVRALLPDLNEDAPLAGLLERLLADRARHARHPPRRPRCAALAPRGDRRGRARARVPADGDRIRRRPAAARPASGMWRAPARPG